MVQTHTPCSRLQRSLSRPVSTRHTLSTAPLGDVSAPPQASSWPAVMPARHPSTGPAGTPQVDKVQLPPGLLVLPLPSHSHLGCPQHHLPSGQRPAKAHPCNTCHVAHCTEHRPLPTSVPKPPHPDTPPVRGGPKPHRSPAPVAHFVRAAPHGTGRPSPAPVPASSRQAPPLHPGHAPQPCPSTRGQVVVRLPRTPATGASTEGAPSPPCSRLHALAPVRYPLGSWTVRPPCPRAAEGGWPQRSWAGTLPGSRGGRLRTRAQRGG